MAKSVPHAIIGSSTSSSTDSPVTLLAGQGDAVFKHMVLINPSGSGAGQWSDGNFTSSDNTGTFAAGPSATLILDSGRLPNGLKVRRLPGGSNVSGAFIAIF